MEPEDAYNDAVNELDSFRMAYEDLKDDNDRLREENEDLLYELEQRPSAKPETCRRCGERKFIRADGYCSVGCSLGYKPGEWWR